MKVSYGWLRTFLQIDEDPEEVSAILTDLGLEVEGLEEFESIPGSLEGVVVGEVLECSKHPNADKLKLTRVDLGDGEPVQIVCGAPNVDKGQKVPVATVGTTLYTAEGESWKIKKGKIRGEVSQGMICAEDELGLGQSHEGIMVLDPKLEPGTPCNQIFDVYRDTQIEIGLTPNRSDAMSHFGVARDLRAGLIQRGIHKDLIPRSYTTYELSHTQPGFEVNVESPDRAPRYAGLIIRGFEVAPSPDWLQNRLRSIGLKPINNVVDITNYVLHDVGQPLHAFDLDKIAGKTIRVGQVPDGTPFITLDGEERILHSEDLMICDAEKPLCIAGVYGGLDSGVSESTTGIFLESAYFDPVSIRKTAKRHGLSTDASFRFERGIDVNGVLDYLFYAADLIVRIAGGQVESRAWDLHEALPSHDTLSMSYDDVRRVAGGHIPDMNIRAILESLDIAIVDEKDGILNLRPPQYRQDVVRKIDVIEEILRVFGYNNIPSSKDFSFSLPPYQADLNEKLRSEIAGLLCYQGFSEIMTNSLVPLSDRAETNQNRVRLINPLSSELAEMRSEILTSGLQVVAHNLNRKQQELMFFEFGHTYQMDAGAYRQASVLGIWCARAGKADQWIPRPKTSRFFELKGVVESLFYKLGLSPVVVERTHTLIEGETLSLEDKESQVEFARIIQVSPELLAGFDIDVPLAFAEIHWETVMAALKNDSIQFREIPKYPEVYRDFSLLIDRSVSFAELKQSIYPIDRKLIRSVQLFDVFEGKELGKDKKAYGLRITLMDTKKTLTEKHIDQVVQRIVDSLEKQFKAQLR